MTRTEETKIRGLGLESKAVTTATRDHTTILTSLVPNLSAAFSLFCPHNDLLSKVEEDILSR